MKRLITWAVAALLTLPFAGTALASPANPATPSLDGQAFAQKDKKRPRKGFRKGKRKTPGFLKKGRTPCRVARLIAKFTKNKDLAAAAKKGGSMQKAAAKRCRAILKSLRKGKKGAKKARKARKGAKKGKIRPLMCRWALKRARKTKNKKAFGAARNAVKEYREGGAICRKALRKAIKKRKGAKKLAKAAKKGGSGGEAPPSAPAIEKAAAPAPETAPTEAEVDAEPEEDDGEE